MKKDRNKWDGNSFFIYRERESDMPMKRLRIFLIAVVVKKRLSRNQHLSFTDVCDCQIRAANNKSIYLYFKLLNIFPYFHNLKRANDKKQHIILNQTFYINFLW